MTEDRAAHADIENASPAENASPVGGDIDANGNPMLVDDDALAMLRASNPVLTPLDDEPDTVLIVDDDPITRAILGEIFKDDHAIEEAAEGREALALVLANPLRYCAILLDFAMEGMDGIEFLRHLNTRGIAQLIPVFLISSEADAVSKDAYDLGVMDVIRKPIVPHMVERRVNSVIELFSSRRRLSSTVESQNTQLLDQAKRIINLSNGMVEALAAAIEFRDGESGEHVRRIRTITRMMLEGTSLGEGLTPEDIDAIELASMMHDVGKIAIPDAILLKPGRLTPEEFTVIKSHTVVGAELMEGIPQFRELDAYEYAVDIARHHHERWDGSGYPDGLVGDEISPWAQAVSLADVYDALRSKRVYKPSLDRITALEMIKCGDCGAFNPKLLKTFEAVEPAINRMY